MRLILMAALITLGPGAMAAEPAAPETKASPNAGRSQFNLSQLRQLERRLPEGWKLLPDGDLLLPDGQRLTPHHVMSAAAPTTCYFIRSLRPITQEDLAEAPPGNDGKSKPASPRMIPLQARVAGVVYQPVCAEAGQPIHAVYDGSGKRK